MKCYIIDHLKLLVILNMMDIKGGSATRADTANEKRTKNKVNTPFMDNICGAKWLTCIY